MTIKELEERLEEPKNIIERWKESNADIDDLYGAIIDAFDGVKQAIVDYLKEK